MLPGEAHPKSSRSEFHHEESEGDKNPNEIGRSGLKASGNGNSGSRAGHIIEKLAEKRREAKGQHIDGHAGDDLVRAKTDDEESVNCSEQDSAGHANEGTKPGRVSC